LDDRFGQRHELVSAVTLYGSDNGIDGFGAFRRNDPERFARTRELILEVYDAMAVAAEKGEPYQTLLDPPPGHGPRHPDRRDRPGRD
jgi:hypothetical protein